jgi:hypothetical protein
LQQKLNQFRSKEDTTKTKQPIPTPTADSQDSTFKTVASPIKSQKHLSDQQIGTRNDANAAKKDQKVASSETGIKIDHLFIKNWDNQNIAKEEISYDGLRGSKGANSKSLEKKEDVISPERKRSVEKLNQFKKAEDRRRNEAKSVVSQKN